MQDAAKTLQHALELGTDAAATQNLLVCCYALGDVPAMQDSFQKLVQVGPSTIKLQSTDKVPLQSTTSKAHAKMVESLTAPSSVAFIMSADCQDIA